MTSRSIRGGASGGLRTLALAALSLALATPVEAAPRKAAPRAKAPAAAPKPPAQVGTQAPGFYRMMLGDYEITVLSDGTTSRQVDRIMSKPEPIRQAMADAHQALPIELSINAFLINTGSRLILVDTGAGDLFGLASGGRLLGNLRTAGYRPDQVDAVLLTHIHADHSGGLTAAGKRVFPKAVVHVDRRDPELWLSPEAEAAAPDADKARFRQARAAIAPYAEAGKLNSFDGAKELYPGVRAMPAYGHTPGHTAYLVESRGKKLILWGDIVHVAEVQFADPEITIDFDVDRPAAIVARNRLLEETARDGELVGGAHISFPGLGHVRANPIGYSWIPLPYSAGWRPATPPALEKPAKPAKPSRRR